MEPQTILAASIVLVLGSAIQSAAGFGFGMFAIPLLILMGVEPFAAIAIISICGLIQTLFGVWLLRRHVVWLQVLWMGVLAGLFIPVGVWTLGHIVDSVSIDTVRQIFGAIVLAALIVQWTARVRPRARLHWGWSAAAMPVSGFMTGLAGMGGPPVVLWIMAQTWSNPRSRATLWAFFTATTPVSWWALHQRFGEGVFTALGTGLLLSPVMLLGILPGLWIGHRISRDRLRQVSYAILLLVSLYAIVGPML